MSQRPNILLIMSDQHELRGHPNVRTPNLDSIAVRGAACRGGYIYPPPRADRGSATETILAQLRNSRRRTGRPRHDNPLGGQRGLARTVSSSGNPRGCRASSMSASATPDPKSVKEAPVSWPARLREAKTRLLRGPYSCVLRGSPSPAPSMSPDAPNSNITPGPVFGGKARRDAQV